MEQLLFVYGTLKKKDVQKEVIGREINGEDDVLSGYTVSRVKIGNEIYPALVREDRKRVHGTVLKLDEDELGKIDDYETEVYRRVRVTLESGKSAWAYLLA